MLPGEVSAQVEGFIAALERVAPGQVAAVYAVGAIALDDFSSRLSNIDLVVVADPPLTPAQTGRLGRAERGLKRARRRAAIWYTTWEEVADNPGVPPLPTAAPGATEGPESSSPIPAAPVPPPPQAPGGPESSQTPAAPASSSSQAPAAPASQTPAAPASQAPRLRPRLPPRPRRLRPRLRPQPRPHLRCPRRSPPPSPGPCSATTRWP